MVLEEIVRRNRRRILFVTVVAVVNYWVVSSLFAWLFVWIWFVGKFASGFTAPPVVVGASSMAIGGAFAAIVVAGRLDAVRPQTIEGLGAVAIAPGEFPMIDNLLEALALAVGVPRVAAALVADDAPNALAVGRRPQDTTLVLTSGLIEKLTRDEVEAVLAVELCAVRRLDTALETVTLACTEQTILTHRSMREGWKDPRSWAGILVTWPTMAVAELLRLWALRSGDFGADRMAVAVTRNPEALRRALRKLENDATTVGVYQPSTALLWFEPLPHDDPDRSREFRALRLVPTLSERSRRLSATVAGSQP